MMLHKISFDGLNSHQHNRLSDYQTTANTANIRVYKQFLVPAASAPTWNGKYYSLPDYFASIHATAMSFQAARNKFYLKQQQAKLESSLKGKLFKVYSQSQRQTKKQLGEIDVTEATFVRAVIKNLPDSINDKFAQITNVFDCLEQSSVGKANQIVTIDAFLEVFMRALPEKLPQLVRQSCCEQLQELDLCKFPSVHAFFWKYKKLVKQAGLEKCNAFEDYFINAITPSLRVAIASNEKLITEDILEKTNRFEGWRVGDSMVKPRVVATQYHHDKLLFLSYVPTTLFLDIIKFTVQHYDPTYAYSTKSRGSIAYINDEDTISWDSDPTFASYSNIKYNQGLIFQDKFKLHVSPIQFAQVIQFWAKCLYQTTNNICFFNKFVAYGFMSKPGDLGQVTLCNPFATRESGINANYSAPVVVEPGQEKFVRRYPPWKIVAMAVYADLDDDHIVLMMTCTETYEIELLSIPKPSNGSQLSCTYLFDQFLYRHFHRKGYPDAILAPRHSILVNIIHEFTDTMLSHGISVYFDIAADSRTRSLQGAHAQFLELVLLHEDIDIGNTGMLTTLAQRFSQQSLAVCTPIYSASLYSFAASVAKDAMIDAVDWLRHVEYHCRNMEDLQNAMITGLKTQNQPGGSLQSELVIQQPKFLRDPLIPVPWQYYSFDVPYSENCKSCQLKAIDKVVHSGRLYRLVQIMAYTEYLGIPCFKLELSTLPVSLDQDSDLSSTSMRIFGWYWGYQVSCLSDKIKEELKQIFAKSKCVQIPRKLRYFMR